MIDKDGYPTTNPTAVQEGGFLLPFGGHKGFALMMAVEFLGQVLVGSDAVENEGMGTPGDDSAGRLDHRHPRRRLPS